jgi:hypothetical protein
LRQEYSEVNNYIRSHSNLRFTIFTVYLAALGGLFSIELFASKYGDEQIKLFGKFGGLLVTLLFFFYELRIQSLIDHNIKTGKELEIALGYNNIRSRPSWLFRTSYMTTIVFLVLIVCWIIWIVRPSLLDWKPDQKEPSLGNNGRLAPFQFFARL